MRRTWILAAALALAALVASPALAQKAKTSGSAAPQIIVTEANLPQAYTALGAVTANVHPKSMNPKTPTHDLLDAELRRQAAAMGADAVVQVRYVIRNPMMSDKGSDAMGVAVRFISVAAAAPASVPAAAPTQLAAAQPATTVTPPAAQAVPPSAQAFAAAPATTPVAPPPASPQVAATAPRAAPAVVPTQAAPAAPPPGSNIVTVTSLGLADSSVGTRHATSADMIVVTDADFAGRRYTRVGDVRSEVHPKSMFPKVTSHDLLNTDLKAQALKLGADAVILVKYNMHSALTSTKGDIATGVAVRFE